MTSKQSQSTRTTQADLDAALMSKLAYGDISRIQKLAPDSTDRMSIREALGPQTGQRSGESTLTEQQSRYMDQRFEVVDVRDFGDSIHGVALRDRETGEVTVAFPGTNLNERSDLGRMATIVADGTMGVTKDAEQFVKDMAAKHGPVRLTGHSAGAALAMTINDRVGEDVVASVVASGAHWAGAVVSDPEARSYHSKSFNEREQTGCNYT